MQVQDLLNSDCALLIIDMQNAFLHEEGSLSKLGQDTTRLKKVINPIKILSDHFRTHNKPIIHVKQTHRKDGAGTGTLPNALFNMGHCVEGNWDWEIIDELKPKSNDYVINKHRFSGFYNTILDDILRQLKVKTLLVSGVTTNICVESTVRDAFYRDYRIIVPRETTASFTEEQEKGSFSNFEYVFAKVISLDEMLH